MNFRISWLNCTTLFKRKILESSNFEQKWVFCNSIFEASLIVRYTANDSYLFYRSTIHKNHLNSLESFALFLRTSKSQSMRELMTSPTWLEIICIIGIFSSLPTFDPSFLDSIWIAVSSCFSSFLHFFVEWNRKK